MRVYDLWRGWQCRWLLLQHFTAYKQHYRGMLCENKSEKSIFPLLCLTGELRERERERRRHGEEDIEGERQDTLIWRGLVLTSLWEALFSLPWKESIWLILQAVASPCSLTSPSFGYTRIRSQKCICCFAKWKIRKSRILLTSRKVPSFLLC